MMQTLTAKLKQIADQYPSQIAMQSKREGQYVHFTYQEMYDQVEKIAQSLLAVGLQKGDRVALILENRPEWGIIYFGILLAGGIVVPLDSASSAEDFTYYFQHADVRMVFASQQTVSTFQEVLSHAKSLMQVVILEGDPKNLPVHGITLENFMAHGAERVSFPAIEPTDIASILYTSGTTAKPKGVMLTHQNFYANYLSTEQIPGLSFQNHNILSILPLHHSFPFMVTLLIPLFAHSTITYVSSMKRDDILACMRETGVTVIASVPQFYVLLAESLKKRIKHLPVLIRGPLRLMSSVFNGTRKLTGINLNRVLWKKAHRLFGKKLQYFICGGATLSSEAEKFLNQLGFTIIQGYGLTETSPIVTFNFPKHPKMGSVGKALPNVEINIHKPDESGVGEVIIRGQNVMHGYYHQPEETQQVLKDGWFYSGDLGFLDRARYLYLTGRKKELIVLSSGKNISPVEVEEHYGKSQYVKELCVLSVVDQGEEKLMAVIVPNFEALKMHHQANIYGSVKWDLENFSKHYPAYKRIMGFIVTQQALPRTRLGKLQRYKISEQYRGQLLGGKAKIAMVALSVADQKILSSSLCQTILKVMQDEKSIDHPIQLDEHLEIDLGFDSLSRVELIASLEKNLSVHVPEEQLVNVFTVRDLVTTLEAFLQSTPTADVAGKKEFGSATVWKDILMRDPESSIRDQLDVYPTRMAKWLARLFCRTLHFFFRLMFHIKVNGVEHLPIDRPFILCPNHACFLDAFFVASVLPKRTSLRIFFLGFFVYFDVPVIRHLIKIGRIIPIDPTIKLIEAMQASSYVLRKKRSVCIFPEGMRSIDGKIQPFKKGVGILAKELNVPIVPVYIKGSYEVWPRTKKFLRLRPVEIFIGQPCEVSALQSLGEKWGSEDAYTAVTLGLQHVVEDLASVVSR